jgi:hypothetical protein
MAYYFHENISFAVWYALTLQNIYFTSHTPFTHERESMKIAITVIGYVGLANAVLLPQHNEGVAFDISQSHVIAICHKT